MFTEKKMANALKSEFFHNILYYVEIFLSKIVNIHIIKL